MVSRRGLILSTRYASERDFVAQFILPKIKAAATVLDVTDVMDFAVEKKVHNLIMDFAAERVGIPVFLVEAKFKKGSGKNEVDIEPRDPDVVSQAVNYAALGGYPYYATCNLRRLVLYRLQPGVGAFESEVARFDFGQNTDWAERVLKITLGKEKAEPKPLDDTLVEILFEAYNDLYPEFLDSLKLKLEQLEFSERFVDWIQRQGQELSDETVLRVASQATYMELNKFLFYHVIRLIYPERLGPLKIELHEDVASALQRFYEAVRAIDYAPIYERTLISEIPLSTRIEARIRTLLDTLNDFDFGKMESDFIGRMYEKLIPPAERKRLGQFYTPPGIVEFITHLTILDPDAVVLDPGCGSGGFLVGAYHRLRELKGYKSDSKGLLAYTYHQKILEQVYGVDINQFPAHLSVINLAVQNPRARVKQINVLVEDFFNIRPGISTLTGFQSFTAEGNKAKVSLPPFFDVVLGNPPYIRQELLSEEEKVRIKQLIESEYKGKVFIGSGPENETILNKQSDIYIYFIIHGLKLLKDSGRLGFITSNKWLEVSYGESFQSFLVDNAKILYVIEFDRAIFPDAEVNTAIIILEKEKNKRNRDINEVKFIRLKEKMDFDSQIRRVQDIKVNFESDSIIINKIRQKDLKPGKWNVYLRAPTVYGKIIKKSKICSLSDVAKVMRAPTTGNNDYFILNKERVDEWKIEAEFLEPCLPSPKDVRGMIVKETNNFMFFINKNKSEIKGTNALKYIEYGEQLEVEVKRGSNRGFKKLPEIETLKSRKPFWYSLPKSQAPPILFPRLIDVKPIFLKNIIKAHTPHVFYYIYPNQSEFTDILLAFLNSSLAALIIELNGRSYGGGVLELLVYEIEKLPVLNPQNLTDGEKDELLDIYNKLITSNDMQIAEYFKKLDSIIYNILELSEQERQQVEKGLKELQEIRRLRTVI